MMGKPNVPAAIPALAGVDCYYAQYPGSQTCSSACVKEDLTFALFNTTQSSRTSARRLVGLEDMKLRLSILNYS
jgi:hypothetical protein